MKNLISARLAGNLLLIALVVLAIFDLLVLFGLVPSNIVWGGAVQDSTSNLVLLELVAFVVTCIFAVIVAIKLRYIPLSGFSRAVTLGIWIIFVYLLLNTIGNLASGVTFEKLIFAPLTILMALCALRLAID